MLYHNTMRKTCFAIITLLILSPAVSAELSVPDELFPPGSEITRELLTSGEFTQSMSEGPGFLLIPETSLSAKIQETAGIEGKFAGTESLFLLPFPEHADPLLFLLNRLTAISTLKDIKYYSESRGKYRTLFTQAYVMESADTNKPVPDPVYTVLPDKNSFSVFLDDTTFGEAGYRLSFQTTEDCILATLINSTPLSLGPIRVMNGEDMTLTLLAVPRGNSLLLYASGTAKTEKGPLFIRTIEKSLYNRILAIKEWLAKGLSFYNTHKG
jgi:hypothetical protein